MTKMWKFDNYIIYVHLKVVYYLYDIWITAYMIKFVSDLQQVGGFLWVLQFPSPIKRTAKI
jgi:hypothetical protein